MEGKKLLVSLVKNAKFPDCFLIREAKAMESFNSYAIVDGDFEGRVSVVL